MLIAVTKSYTIVIKLYKEIEECSSKESPETKPNNSAKQKRRKIPWKLFPRIRAAIKFPTERIRSILLPVKIVKRIPETTKLRREEYCQEHVQPTRWIVFL